MGEYALYHGSRIKMGTCEDMYYLRADQAGLVQPERGSLDPTDPDTQRVIRFRFPWPDEDGTEPGEFNPYERTVGIWDVSLPQGLEHGRVQFVARAGYVMSIPCPESSAAQPFPIHRNGFKGPVQIVQQAYREGALATICQCGGCDYKYRLDAEHAIPIIEACAANAARARLPGGEGESRAAWWEEVGKRIAKGYQ